MERGILKRLPEVLWQHEIYSISVPVEFTEPGFFEYIYKSLPLSNLDPRFLHFLDLFFSQNAADPETKMAKCLCHCSMINLVGKEELTKICENEMNHL